MNNNNNHFKFALKHSIIFYVVFIVGLSYHLYFFLNIFSILTYSVKNSLIHSIIITTIFYIIMITFFSLNLITKFSKLYYIFFLSIAIFYFFGITSIITIIIIFILKINSYFLIFTFYIIFGIFLTLIGIYNEQNTISDRKKITIKNLLKNITIAHLTDMHLGAIYGKEFVTKIVKIIQNENVDIVIITGDMVDGNISLTNEMLEPFNMLNIPVYYVTGNHEDYTNKNETLNIIHNSCLIHIQNQIINVNNNINLIGIDYNSNVDDVKMELKNLLVNNNNNLPNIFCYHVPIFLPENLNEFNISLFLCGHTHGGQVFPLHILYKYMYGILEGLYDYNKINYIYCCSGCGTGWCPVRFFSKSKIGILELISDKNILY